MSKNLALISVSNKAGITELARALENAGYQIVSTGGTSVHLRKDGLNVIDVSEVTGFPEILDGRVKTLHPAVHGGILARRDLSEHMRVIEEKGFAKIEFVIVNLYPFVEASKNPKLNFEEVVEQIDIGGPSMLRSAAKNFSAVTVVVDPADYSRVIDQVNAEKKTTETLRRELAAKAFTHTAIYDGAIANWLSAKAAPEELGWPAVYTISMPLGQAMRYGENPHQAAAFYRDPTCKETSVAGAKQLQGKELSYNNILDAEGALEMVRDFADLAPSAAVIVKHSNPCGIAIGKTPAEAYERARQTDPDSAFGGIIAISSAVDEAAAEAIAATFNEIVIAPSYTAGALEILAKKKNMRVLETGPFDEKKPQQLVRGVVGGILVMDRDLGKATAGDLRVVTETAPSPEELKGLLFAWRAVKWVKSNAIVYTTENTTVGIGAGQMSRIDSANFGALKARRSLSGCFMASDAFFPFRDCVDIAAKHGIKAIIQPGGSVRDDESIAAANEHRIAMVFTGMRHFRH